MLAVIYTTNMSLHSTFRGMPWRPGNQHGSIWHVAFLWWIHKHWLMAYICIFYLLFAPHTSFFFMHSPLGSISYSYCGSLQEVVTGTEAIHTSPEETLTHTCRTGLQARTKKFLITVKCKARNRGVFTFFIFVWGAHNISTNLPFHLHLSLKERLHQIICYVPCSEITI